MRKIPVRRTIGAAYAFVFGHIGTVVGIAWFPAVLMTAAAYLARAYEAAHSDEIEAGQVAAAGASFAVSLAAILVMVLASAVTAVGITRQALAPRPAAPLFYFALGATEWRMFAADLRYLIGSAVLIGLAALVTAVAFALAGAPLEAPENVQPTPALLLAAVISWVVFIYAFVTILRMGFLLPAVVVAETGMGLTRAHELTRGNVWRILLIVVALSFPVLLLLGAGEVVLLRAQGVFDVARLTPAELMRRMNEAMADKAIAWEVFTAVLFVLASGLVYSGTAFAYRALVPEGTSAQG